MASEDGTPADVAANGAYTLLPSPPSTVSSVATPGRPVSPQPHGAHGDGKKKRRQRPRSAPVSPLQQQSSVLSPRPAQDLLVERSYLVDSLAAQGARASALIQKLSMAEQAAAAGEGGRRLRKQIALLKSKITAAAEQEKAVIVRLGELYVEMQSRERWARAQAQAQAQAQAIRSGYFSVMPPGEGVAAAMEEPVWKEMSLSTGLIPMAPVPAAAGPEPEHVSIKTGLSPLSPEFVPTWAQGKNPWPMPDVPVPPEQ